MAQCVADGDGDVAQPALMADAPDRAALGEAKKLVLRPAEQLGELPSGQAFPFIEVRQSATPRVLVPGADQLAVIAAIDAVAHQWPQVFRNRAAMFDGEVG